MKKVLLLILSFCFFSVACSCKNEIDLETYLSQKRTAVYVCDNKEYGLSVFIEERENPFLSDGFVGTISKFITVKIENFTSSLDEVSVTVNYDENSVSKKLDYNPINGKFTAEILVENLPNSDEISVSVVNMGEEKTLTLTRLKCEKIDYKTALNSVSKTAKNEIENMLKNGATIEVRLRLLPEGDRYYYYVSITDNNKKTLAFLVDGETAKILATKTL